MQDIIVVEISMKNLQSSMKTILTFLYSLLILTLTAASSNAISYGMIGYKIVDVDKIEELNCPIYGDYDCFTWPNNFYKMGFRCMTLYTSIFPTGYEDVILIEKHSNFKIVSQSYLSFNATSVERFYQCPSRY